MKVWAPLLAVAILAFPPCAASSSSSQRARGAVLFATAGCQHCHTIRHAGGHKGPDLSGVGRRKSKSVMRRQILYGSKVMPAFGNVLMPQELNDIIAYLRSCRDKPKK